MKYLCVETTGNQGFVAFFSGSNKQMEYFLDKGRHSENITLSLQPFLTYLKETNTKIDFIAVDVGPGRFTGIRVGVNFSKAVAYYLKIPIYPCCSLRIMVDSFLENKAWPVVCLMEAFGQMFYTGIYRRNNNSVENILKPIALSLSELEEHINQPMFCVGDVYEKKKHLFSEKVRSFLKPVGNNSISSENFSNTILSEWSPDQLQLWSQVEPCYLRIPGVIQQ